MHECSELPNTTWKQSGGTSGWFPYWDRHLQRDKMQFSATAITERVGKGHWIMVYNKNFQTRMVLTWRIDHRGMFAQTERFRESSQQQVCRLHQHHHRDARLKTTKCKGTTYLKHQPQEEHHSNTGNNICMVLDDKLVAHHGWVLVRLLSDRHVGAVVFDYMLRISNLSFRQQQNYAWNRGRPKLTSPSYKRRARQAALEWRVIL